VYNGGASNNAAVCDLVPSAGNADRFIATAIPNQYAAASATMTVTLPSTGTVAFKCIGNTHGFGAVIAEAEVICASAPAGPRSRPGQAPPSSSDI